MRSEKTTMNWNFYVFPLQMGHEDVMISSKLVSRVTELPYGVDPDYLPLKSEKVTTRMESEDRLKDDGIPWWWILIAILIGILLLSLIVFILWKVICYYP